MKSGSRPLIILLVCCVLAGLIACTATDSPSISGAQITDQVGRVVKIDKIPGKIISVAPSITEMLYALGLADKVVAVTDYDDYPPEAKSKPSIGGYSTPNIEKIVSYAPDIIFAGSLGAKTYVPQLEVKCLKVIVLEPKSLAQIKEALTLIGKMTGKENEAQRLVADMEARTKVVTKKTDSLKADQKPKVFYPVWHDPLMGGGVGTMHDELISKAGGINITAGLSGYANFNLEALLEANPDIMIAGVTHGSDGSATLEYLKTEPRLGNTTARQKNQVYTVDGNLVSRAGPRSVDGLEELARLIHPKLFGR